MINDGWRVRFTRSELPTPTSPMPFVALLPGQRERWLREAGIAEGTPLLVSPSFEYDVVLNPGGSSPFGYPG